MSDCVELCDGPQLGFHVQARRDLALGETVITMPASFMVNEATLLDSPIAAALADGRSYADHEVAIEAYHEELVKMSGEELLADILFHREKAGKPLDAKDRTIANAPMTDRGLLVAFLVHARFDHREGGKESSTNPALAKPNSWAPFAQSIPDNFNLPLLWAPADLRLLADCLLGHGVLRSVAAMTRLVAHDFEKLRVRLASPTHHAVALRALLGPSLGLTSVAFGDAYSTSSTSAGTSLAENEDLARPALEGGWGEAAFEKFLWASAAASSRSFGDVNAMAGDAVSDDAASGKSLLGSGRRSGLGVMVPVLDFLNHDPESAQIEWVSGNSSSSSNTAGSLNPGNSGSLPRAVLRKKVRAGEQVLTHYGAHRPNDELLICYGFAAWPPQGKQEARTSREAASLQEDVLEIGWGLDDAPGSREVWLSGGSAGAGPGNPKLDAFVVAMDRGGRTNDASATSTSSNNSEGKSSSPEAVQRQRLLATALVRGERIEVALTLEAPIGELVAIARALTAVAGDAQMPALPAATSESVSAGGSTHFIGGNHGSNSEEATNEIAAWAYLNTFLDAKLAKLMSHLQAALGERFPAPDALSVRKSHYSASQRTESGGAELKAAEGSTAAAEPLSAAQWWHAVVNGARGNGAGKGNVVIGKNIYATSAENCVIAAFHSKVNILQHAAATAASQLGDLRSRVR